MSTGWMSDVRLACRHLAKRPAFTCVAGGVGSVVLLRLLASQLSAFTADGLEPVACTMVAAPLDAAAPMACIVPA